jgi:glycosyltransferase involved in cell wall biosynthesis
LIADDPSDLAAAVLWLLSDPGLRDTLGRNGRRAVEARFDWQTIGDRFNEFIEMVVQQAR